MKSKNSHQLIITILLTTLGIGMFGARIFNDHIPFGIGAIGIAIAIAGISVETYRKNKKDTVTKKGEKRSEIERNDERNLMIQAKSGNTINNIMDFCTVVIAGLSVYFNLSFIGQMLIFSLLIIRILIRPIVKGYYESHV